MPAAHRHGDVRNCGATTIVQGQGTVYVNGNLWSVEGDPNTHGAGDLIATGSTVFIENIKVIVHTPDNAQPDFAGHVNPQTGAGSGDVFAYGGGSGGGSMTTFGEGTFDNNTFG
jgi:hypothetical protein